MKQKKIINLMLIIAMMSTSEVMFAACSVSSIVEAVQKKQSEQNEIIQEIDFDQIQETDFDVIQEIDFMDRCNGKVGGIDNCDLNKVVSLAKQGKNTQEIKELCNKTQ